MAFFHTVPGSQWSRVDSRCWDHPGWIVDLGCLSWDWSNCFLAKKRVIGVDPQENETPGAIFFKGGIAGRTGTAALNGEGIGATIMPAETGFKTLTWADFIAKYKIDDIAVLKVNIEGSEYDLIPSLTPQNFARIDQIAISFHHFVNPAWLPCTKQCLQIIAAHGYSIYDLEIYGWYLCVKNL